MPLDLPSRLERVHVFGMKRTSAKVCAWIGCALGRQGKLLANLSRRRRRRRHLQLEEMRWRMQIRAIGFLLGWLFVVVFFSLAVVVVVKSTLRLNWRCLSAERRPPSSFLLFIVIAYLVCRLRAETDSLAGPSDSLAELLSCSLARSLVSQS